MEFNKKKNVPDSGTKNRWIKIRNAVCVTVGAFRDCFLASIVAVGAFRDCFLASIVAVTVLLGVVLFKDGKIQIDIPPFLQVFAIARVWGFILATIRKMQEILDDDVTFYSIIYELAGVAFMLIPIGKTTFFIIMGMSGFDIIIRGILKCLADINAQSVEMVIIIYEVEYGTAVQKRK